jgi:hypothetical protein
MEKLCWWCTHFYFDGGDLGYSEYTPGSDASFNCYKKAFKGFKGRGSISPMELFSTDSLRELIESAKTCEYFEAKVDV